MDHADIEENQTLLSSEQVNLANRARSIRQEEDENEGHGSLSKYFQPFWRVPRSSGGKSPVPLLSRPHSPEEAPLLDSRRRTSPVLSREISFSSPRTHDSLTSLRKCPRNSTSASSNGLPSHARDKTRSPLFGYIILAVISASLVSIAPILTNLLYDINDLNDNQYCVNSIYFAHSTLEFSDSNGNVSNQACQNIFRITSMYAAAKTYCEPSHINPGFEAVAKDCRNAGAELLGRTAIEANLTDERIRQLRVVTLEDVDQLGVLGEPVLISEQWYRKVFKTISIWYFEMGTHHSYGFVIYGFWAVVILFGIVTNIWAAISDQRRAHTATDVEGVSSAKRRPLRILVPFRSTSHWFRTHIMIPAAFGTHHQRLWYWCTIPSRFDSIVVCSFWILSITLSCISYRIMPDNYFWPDWERQLLRYVADRTGIMSYATLSLIWAFATRNNGFLWATGWSYRTFNIYHRHVARVGTLLAIVHSIAYSYLYLGWSGFASYKEAMSEKWLLLGGVATVTMSFLWVFSHAWIRVKFYESFLMLHIALSVVTLVCLFAHTAIFEGAYDPYLWPVVAIWCCDRFLRLVRIVCFNFRVRFGGNMIRTTSTIAIYNKDSDVIRLEVRPALAGIMPSPGQFYHLYQPSTWTGYENHPFTLGAWSPNALDDARKESEIEKDNKQAENNSDSDLGCSSGPSSSSGIESSHESLIQHTSNPQDQTTPTTLIFWIRPYDGWTKKLRNSCLRSANHTCHPTLLLEGPYGHTSPLHTHDTILLITGGTGIAAAVPYILSHVSRTRNHNSTRTSNIHLVWTVRQKAFIEEICNEELAPALQLPEFRASFFTTRSSSRANASELYEGLPPEGKATGARLPKIRVRHARPNIREMILRAAREEEQVGGSVAVLVCGPAGMADQARSAVHEAMKNGCRGIEYLEEAFGW